MTFGKRAILAVAATLVAGILLWSMQAIEVEAEESDLPETILTTEEVAEETGPSLTERLKSVRGFIWSGDASKLAEYVDVTMTARVIEVENREFAVAEREMLSDELMLSLDASSVRIDGVTTCILKHMEVRVGSSDAAD